MQRFLVQSKITNVCVVNINAQAPWVCEKCGVEVTLSKVRRENGSYRISSTRCTHLVSEVTTIKDRLNDGYDFETNEKVLYFEAFIVIDGGLTPYETGTY